MGPLGTARGGSRELCDARALGFFRSVQLFEMEAAILYIPRIGIPTITIYELRCLTRDTALLTLYLLLRFESVT